MNAREILDEVRVEEQKRAKGRDGPPPRAEEAPFRKWKIERYTEAIRLDPSLAEAYVERGTELYFVGRRAEARADVRKALSLGVSDPELYGEMSFPFEGDEKREILRAGMALIDRTSEESGWFYEHLYSDLIRSYWYDGNFTEQVRLLEEWIPQLNQAEHMYRHSLQDLATAYSALGKHADAEAAYRRALAAYPPDERWHVADMIVRTRMHRNAFGEARQALGEIGDDLPVHLRAMLNAALAVLASPGSDEARIASAAALAVAEEQGRLPGPAGSKTSYYSFLLGLVYTGVGKNQQAEEILKRFADESAANKKEWGITMRWEISKARELCT